MPPANGETYINIIIMTIIMVCIFVGFHGAWARQDHVHLGLFYRKCGRTGTIRGICIFIWNTRKAETACETIKSVQFCGAKFKASKINPQNFIGRISSDRLWIILRLK